MAALNQAKIINALEAVVTQQHENFIYDFLLAYGTPKSTINRLKMGDAQRNVTCVAGDVAVPQKLYFRAVVGGTSVTDALEEIISLPLLEQHKIRFVLVTDFVTVAAYDRKVKDNTEFDFSELKLNYEFFLPLTGKYEKAIEHAEHPADVKACEKWVGCMIAFVLSTITLRTSCTRSMFFSHVSCFVSLLKTQAFSPKSTR